MTYVNDFQLLLGKSDWEKYSDTLFSFSNEFYLNELRDSYTLAEIINNELNVGHWENEFNLKLMSTDINFAYVNAYYEKLKESSNNDKLYYHFWFNYECESLLVRLLGLVDMFCQIVNVKFELNLKDKAGFNKEVASVLKRKGEKFGEFLIDHSNDERFKDIGLLRNQFAHSQSPLNPKAPLKKVESSGMIKFSMLNEPDVTEPFEIFKRIDIFNEWFAELINEYKLVTNTTVAK